MRKTIDDVKKNILQKEILWAYPIARKLKKSHYRLTIKWASECIKIYSLKFNSNKFFELNEYIQQALQRFALL